MVRRSVTHVDDPVALGTRLREARVAAGLTQTDISFPGCSVGYVSRIESATRVPSLQVIHELARRLGVDEAWLARGDTGRPPRDEHLLGDADLALRLDQLGEAEATYEALAAAGSPATRARALAGLGQIAFRRDDPGAAVDLLERAYAADRSLADPAAAETLGRALAILGREEEAIAVFRRHQAAAVEAGDRVADLRFSVLLANALIDAGRFGHAADVLGHTLADLEEPDPLALARVYWTQSRLHALRGESDTAAGLAQRAIGLLDGTEHVLFLARAHQVLAHIELDRGEPARAYELVQTGRRQLGALGTPHDHAKFAIEEARALSRLGRLDEAVEVACAPSTTAVGHRADRGRCYTELAGMLARQGDVDRAGELYRLAIEALEEPPSRYLVEACVGYAELLEETGDATAALALYKRAAGVRLRLATG